LAQLPASVGLPERVPGDRRQALAVARAAPGQFKPRNVVPACWMGIRTGSSVSDWELVGLVRHASPSLLALGSLYTILLVRCIGRQLCGGIPLTACSSVCIARIDFPLMIAVAALPVSDGDGATQLEQYAALSPHSSTPTTFPSVVPSRDGPSFPPVVSRSFSNSSGVWHFAVQAWICAISSLSAELTRRCLLSEFLPANSGDTMSVVKA